MAHTTPRVGGKLAAVLALFAMLFAFLPTSPAFAEGSKVQIDSISFKNEKITDGSRQRIDVEWSVPGRAKAPISFSVDLPDGLQGYEDEFPIEAEDGAEAGTCTVTGKQVTCTLTDEFVKSHPKDLRGSFYFQALVSLGNKEETKKTFRFGEASTTVTVKPGSSGEQPGPDTCEGDCELKQVTGNKSGWFGSGDDEGLLVYKVRVEAPAEGIPAGTHVKVQDKLDLSKYDVVGDPVVLQARGWTHDENGWPYPYHGVRTEGVTVSKDKLTVEFEAVAGEGKGTNRKIDDGERTHYGTDGSFYIVEWKVKPKASYRGELNDDGNRVFSNTAQWCLNGKLSDAQKVELVRYSGGANALGTNFGQFELTKELSGDVKVDTPFTVKYTVVNEKGETSEGSFEVKPGETYTSDEFYVGTKVTLEEVLPEDPTLAWAKPQFIDEEGNPADTIEFTKEGNGKLGEVTKIRLVNEGTKKNGTFTAKKVVKNADNVKLDDDLTFTLKYSYPADEAKGIEAGSGTLTLPMDGKAVTSDEIPVGAQVTLTEVNLPKIEGAEWSAPEVSPSTFTIEKADAPVEVTVTNTISKVQEPPADKPQPPAKKTPGLARTGVSAAGLVGLAAIASATGAGALVTARRRSN